MARTLFRLIRPIDQWMGRNMEHKSSFMWNVIMAGQLLTAECVSFSSAYKLILNKSRNEIINSGHLGAPNMFPWVFEGEEVIQFGD